MITFLLRRWFLTLLVLLIPFGLVLGVVLPREQVLDWGRSSIDPLSNYQIALILFLMSVTLDVQRLTSAIRAPAPVLWASLINYAALPLLAIPIAQLQFSQDFAVGIIITATVPATMASASVWTRQANGNDAVSLLVTVVTNGLCFLITPFWLRLALGDSISLDTLEIMRKLFITAVLPIACGQLMRSFLLVRRVADARKVLFGGIAQACILSLIFWSSIKGGGQLQASDTAPLRLIPVLWTWSWCVLLHSLGLALGFYGGRYWGFRREDVVAVVFAGSQKTLPIGIYISSVLLATHNLPFAVFPMLMFHTSQLILDSLLIPPLRTWSQNSPPDNAASKAA